jgi:predicted acetyltransferase
MTADTQTTGTLTVRPVDPEDDATLDAWMSVPALVFTDPHRHTPQLRDFYRVGYVGHRLFGAFDGDTVVATYRCWDWQVTVPGGGTVTADAISTVTVLPTHRRRRALTAMIRADLADAAARGLTAAVLVASEATIYPRYGFGAATDSATWELDLRTARLHERLGREGTVRLVSPQELREAAPTVYQAARRPGAVDRSDRTWDLRCGIVRRPGGEDAPFAAVVHRDRDGTPDGYAIYRWRDDWQERTCRTVVHVQDLQAGTGEATAALWRYLSELDLVATVRAEHRPVDDELPWLLVDPRSAQRVATNDLLWARVLDPVTALAARRYELPGRAVIEVDDPLGHAAGRFALQVDPDGAGHAEPTGAPAEVTLPVDVLSALWLGGGNLHAAAVAGRAVEHDPGALTKLARLLHTTRAPWMNTWF